MYIQHHNLNVIDFEIIHDLMIHMHFGNNISKMMVVITLIELTKLKPTRP